MKKMNKPEQSTIELVQECASNVRSEDLKKRILDSTDGFQSCADQYDINGSKGELYKIDKLNTINDLSSDELKFLYTNKLSKIGQPGRWYYDQLLASAPYGICPYCLQRTVSTIDHVLPQASYPNFSIVPYNLIPACKDCNTGKGEKVPVLAKDVHIHPYYDNVDDFLWLAASVQETNPPTMFFSVKVINEWVDELNERVATHFRLFELGKLYATHSAVEFRNLSYLYKLFEIGGANQVKNHLDLIVTNKAGISKNSWQSAMYKSLADSEWFCNEGVMYLEQN